MDRYWLLTWTCYGHWLPGDRRGFVGNVCDRDGLRAVHNIPGTPFDADIPELEQWTKAHMRGPCVVLSKREAEALIAQFQETARVRRWALQAASVMFNHTHVVLGVTGDPDPGSILNTLKAWATRALKKIRPLPAGGRFWTANGSKRKLPDHAAVQEAVVYVVKRQTRPLAVWWAPVWQDVLDAYDGRRSASRGP